MSRALLLDALRRLPAKLPLALVNLVKVCLVMLVIVVVG